MEILAILMELLNFNENTKELAKFQGIVKVISMNTNNKKRDEHLMSAEYFNEAGFKDMKFVAKKFDGDKIIGDLTIKGITKQAKFEYDFGGINGDKIGFSLETDIYRSDFNIGKSSAMLDNKVEIDIEIEAKRK